MFQAQQNQGRGAPLGANRLQNGKMGESALEGTDTSVG